MATARIFEQFDPREGDIESYLDRLEQYLLALDIECTEGNAAKRRAILLSSVGEEPYKTLRDLTFPADKPTTKSFEELSAFLKDHYCPKEVDSDREI